ncbi:MAG: YHS domain-containing protein [Bacteroidota bacterium]
MATTYRDPVCGMQVTPETAGAHTEYDGQIYYFCSDECRESFEMDPERYLEQEANDRR